MIPTLLPVAAPPPRYHKLTDSVALAVRRGKFGEPNSKIDAFNWTTSDDGPVTTALFPAGSADKRFYWRSGFQVESPKPYEIGTLALETKREGRLKCDWFVKIWHCPSATIRQELRNRRLGTLERLLATDDCQIRGFLTRAERSWLEARVGFAYYGPGAPPAIGGPPVYGFITENGHLSELRQDGRNSGWFVGDYPISKLEKRVLTGVPKRD